MSTIRDLSKMALRVQQPATVWRDSLMPANFDGFPFHVESYSQESGRRIALHEFPKKELPYAEDMGHTAVSFTVRGYIVVYPHDDVTAPPGSLYQRDYRSARDLLRERLDRGDPGVLQLPTFVGRTGPMRVVCTRYRLSEEEKAGGYCVFDMQFVERGKKPFQETPDTQDDLYTKTRDLREQVRQVWAREANKGQRTYLGPIRTGTTSPASEFTNRSTGKASARMGPYNPLVRFVGPPKKMGPIRPATTGPESEFTARSTGKASQPMEMWQTGRA